METADLDAAVPVPHDIPWFPKDQEAWSVRWVILHVINELARHAGHADIIRESIDGATMYELIAGLEGWRARRLGRALAAPVEESVPTSRPESRAARRRDDCLTARVELYYEELGDPAGPPALLIMGLGAQLPMWPDGFCAQLVDARLSRHPLRPPRHRAVGQDARAARRRARSTGGSAATCWAGPASVPYTLVDMTQDVVALLDHLGISRAHVVGASLGGMIAQILAAAEPDRVASLGVIMSTTGKPLSALPAWRVIRLAFDSPAKDAPAEEKLAFEVRNIAVFNGPNFLPPEAELRQARAATRGALHLPAGHAAPVRRRAGHRQPAGLQQGDHRADRGAARLGGPHGAAAQRTRGCGGHSRRAVRRGRRNGTRPSRTGVARRSSRSSARTSPAPRH